MATATSALHGDNYLDIVVPSSSITTDQWVQVRQNVNFNPQPSDWSAAVLVPYNP